MHVFDLGIEYVNNLVIDRDESDMSVILFRDTWFERFQD